MRVVIIILFCLILAHTAVSMQRVGTSNDELDNTAQFRSESPCASPSSSPRSLHIGIEEIPRLATSFLHAFMQTYDVIEGAQIIAFPDYLAPTTQCTLPLNIVTDWIGKMQRESLVLTSPIAVDPLIKDADQRDLLHVCALLYGFTHGSDLLPAHIVDVRLTQLISSNRRLRINAFVRKSLEDIIKTKTLPVHYSLLSQEQIFQELKKVPHSKRINLGALTSVF